MKLNKISAVVPQEQEAQVIDSIKGARATLDFLVNLNSDQRIRMSKLSHRRVDFVDKTAIHIRANPEYLPVYIDTKEFEKEVNLKDCLKRIIAETDAFRERLKDTLLQVSSEAYRTSRLYYKSVKAAAIEGAQDAERIVQDLAYHHKSMGSSKNGDIEDIRNKEENSEKQEEKAA